MNDRKMFKVISAIEGKDGKTKYWNRVGTAFLNRDQSINVILDSYPRSGILQVREFDERDLKKSDHANAAPSQGDMTAALQASLGMPNRAPATDDVQF